MFKDSNESPLWDIVKKILMHDITNKKIQVSEVRLLLVSSTPVAIIYWQFWKLTVSLISSSLTPSPPSPPITMLVYYHRRTPSPTQHWNWGEGGSCLVARAWLFKICENLLKLTIFMATGVQMLIDVTTLLCKRLTGK